MTIRRRNRAVTLLEVTIATLLFAALLSSVYWLMASSSESFSESTVEAALQERARSTVEEMARELRVADIATLSVSSYRGCDRVDFVVPLAGASPDGNAYRWVQYRFEPEPASKGEAASSGRIVRIEGEQMRTLCHNARPGSLFFRRTGHTVLIRLTLHRQDGKTEAAASTVETSVTLRNRSRK